MQKRDVLFPKLSKGERKLLADRLSHPTVGQRAFLALCDGLGVTPAQVAENMKRVGHNRTHATAKCAWCKVKWELPLEITEFPCPNGHFNFLERRKPAKMHVGPQVRSAYKTRAIRARYARRAKENRAITKEMMAKLKRMRAHER